MLYISHRANIFGPNPEIENCPEYITKALELGFDVEIDVWFYNNSFFLGHDVPAYMVNRSFLKQEGIWCHAKNLNALEAMLIDPEIHCFWHQQDDLTLTSKGFIWTFPGKDIANDKAIAVLPENVPDWNYFKAYGVCSDFIGNMRGY